MSEGELRAYAARATELGAEVVKTGQWLWARFRTEPSERVRAELICSGWQWSRKNKSWYLTRR